jgi:hypothetical protein
MTQRHTSFSMPGDAIVCPCDSARGITGDEKDIKASSRTKCAKEDVGNDEREESRLEGNGGQKERSTASTHVRRREVGCKEG